MVSTEQLAQLAGAAQKTGAKFIIAGDDAQLASIERGGMFETLRQKHGAAILTEVQRTQDLEERKLWGKMHKGEFRDMLAKQDKAGNLHWSEK
jgi:ATP-dependent exoDNAse (exonuclease V) alpha subunit